MADDPEYVSMVEKPSKGFFGLGGGDQDPEYVPMAQEQEPKPSPMGMLRGAKNTIMGMPHFAGQVGQAFGIPGSGDLAAWGKSLQPAPHEEGIPEQLGGALGWMAPAGAVSMASTALRLQPHPIGKAIGYALPPLFTLLFGASKYQQTKEEMEAKGMDPGALPLETGAIEVAKMVLFAGIFGGALRGLSGKVMPLAPVMSKTIGTLNKPTAAEVIRNISADVLGTSLSFAGGGAAQHALEKSYGLERPEDILPEAGKTGLVMGLASLITRGAMMYPELKRDRVHSLINDHAMKILEKPDPEHPNNDQDRALIAETIARSLSTNKKNEALADSWRRFAFARIRDKEDIPIDKPLNQMELDINTQLDETSKSIPGFNKELKDTEEKVKKVAGDQKKLSVLGMLKEHIDATRAERNEKALPLLEATKNQHYMAILNSLDKDLDDNKISVQSHAAAVSMLTDPGHMALLPKRWTIRNILFQPGKLFDKRNEADRAELRRLGYGGMVDEFDNSKDEGWKSENWGARTRATHWYLGRGDDRRFGSDIQYSEGADPLHIREEQGHLLQQAWGIDYGDENIPENKARKEKDAKDLAILLNEGKIAEAKAFLKKLKKGPKEAPEVPIGAQGEKITHEKGEGKGAGGVLLGGEKKEPIGGQEPPGSKPVGANATEKEVNERRIFLAQERVDKAKEWVEYVKSQRGKKGLKAAEKELENAENDLSTWKNKTDEELDAIQKQKEERASEAPAIEERRKKALALAEETARLEREEEGKNWKEDLAAAEEEVKKAKENLVFKTQQGKGVKAAQKVLREAEGRLKVNQDLSEEYKKAWPDWAISPGYDKVIDTAKKDDPSGISYSISTEYRDKVEDIARTDTTVKGKLFKTAIDLQNKMDKMRGKGVPLRPYNKLKAWFEKNIEYLASTDPDSLCQKSEGCDIAIRRLKLALGKDKYNDLNLGWEVFARAAERGLKIPCPQCYVYWARKADGSTMQKKFIIGVGGYNGEIARGRAPFNTMSNLFSMIERGLRHYSSTDFKAEHIPGLIVQAVEAQEAGIPMAGYIKELDAARMFGPAGAYFNISSGRNRLIGVDLNEAAREAKKHPGTAVVYISFTKAEILTALRDPRVDHVIPWHSSMAKAEEMKKLIGDQNVEDSTLDQSERHIVDGKVGNKVDPDNPAHIKESDHGGDLQTYLDMVEKRGQMMKFPDIYKMLGEKEKNLFMKLIGPEYGKFTEGRRDLDGNGSLYLPPDASKINTGIIPKVLSSRVKQAAINLDEYTKISDEILKEIKDGTYKQADDVVIAPGELEVEKSFRARIERAQTKVAREEQVKRDETIAKHKEELARARTVREVKKRAEEPDYAIDYDQRQKESIAFADKLDKMSPEERDDVRFNENWYGYQLYEARNLVKKIPVNSEKFKKVTDRNSNVLESEFTHIANVDGEPFGLSNENEDPDNENKFVWSFKHIDGNMDSNRGKETVWGEGAEDEVMKEMRESLKNEKQPPDYSIEEDDIKKLNKTSRNWPGENPQSKYVVETAKKGESVLDYGAGENANQTKYMNESGLKATAYDIGENVQEGIHDRDALSKKYDTVMAGNVINVQLRQDMLDSTLNEIANSMKDGGRAIVNYPLTPRKMGLSVNEMRGQLERKFESVEQVAGPRDRPVWELRDPLPTPDHAIDWYKTSTGDEISEDGDWKIRRYTSAVGSKGSKRGTDLFWVYKKQEGKGSIAMARYTPTGKYNDAVSFSSLKEAKDFVNNIIQTPATDRTFDNVSKEEVRAMQELRRLGIIPTYVGIDTKEINGENKTTGPYSYLIGNNREVVPEINDMGRYPKGIVDAVNKHQDLARELESLKTDHAISPETPLGKAKEKIDEIYKKGLSEFEKLGTLYSAPPQKNTLKSIIGRYTGALQLIDYNLMKDAREINKRFSGPGQQEAISRYMQAGGDETILKYWADNSTTENKQHYQRALKLTPEEKAAAKEFRDKLDKLWMDANEAGIQLAYVTDYVRQQWDRPNQHTQNIISMASSGEFRTNPKEAMKRLFGSYFEGEQAGFKPKDSRIGYQMTAAQRSIQRSIAARMALREMMDSTEKDGRPTIGTAGIGSVVKDMAGVAKAYMIKPNLKDSEIRDYEYLDHPSFHKWQWMANDENGKPIFQEGNLWIHPDAVTKMKALLGKSALREYTLPKEIPFIGGGHPAEWLMRSGAFIKGTILVGPFHMVHVGLHGVFHNVNPFNPREISFEDRPLLKEGVDHGLMLYNHNAMREFGEGIASGGLWNNLPGKWGKSIGSGMTQWQEWLFQGYIPKLKAEMFEQSVARAEKWYAKDLKSGKLTREQMIENVAKQANSAFGEMNYKYMGRDPGLQDMFRIIGLAPDFLEARLKFAGQALRPYGREQQMALLKSAVIMATSAQIANILIGDDHKPHWDRPFSVIAGGREYTPRSVVGDMAHLVTDWRNFAYNRLNPLWGKPVVEGLSGRDRFGRKIDAQQWATNTLKSWAPIPLQGIVRDPTDTILKSITNTFFQSFGLSNYPYRSAFDKAVAEKFEERMVLSAPKEERARLALVRKYGAEIQRMRENKEPIEQTVMQMHEDIKKGKLYREDIQTIYHRARTDTTSTELKSLTAEDLKEIWSEATPEEQKKYAQIRTKKLSNLAAKHPERYKKLKES